MLFSRAVVVLVREVRERLCLVVLGFAFFQYAAISTQAESLGRRVSKVVFHMCLWLYPFASGYVLLESLRQLLYLPERTFLLPSLSIYLPHFS